MHEEDVLRRYDEVEAKLVEAGFPPTSPWWRETIHRWYGRRVRRLVARVGRRGGKSSTFSRLAVVEALYGHHDVPPGDTAWVAIVSTDRKESAGRMRTICAILDALGVKWEPAERLAGAIEIPGRRIGFRTFTASIKGVSGFTALFVFCDEVAKWKDADTGANPAKEVLASIKPTVLTLPHARMVLSSSPWARLDAHHDAYERGEGPDQAVAYAPTWIANPSPETTEAATRLDEPDEAKWEREYAAIPQSEAESSLLTELLVDMARRTPPRLWDLPPQPGARYVAAIDPATRGNAWTLTLLTRDETGRRRVALAREWRGTSKRPLSPGKVFGEIAELLEPYGVRALHSDQWAEDALSEIARGHGLSLLTDEAWSPSAKREAYEALRSALQQDTLELHPDPQLRADLLGIIKRFTRSGATYELLEVDGRHSDYAPALALAAIQPLARAQSLERLSDEEEAARAKHAYLTGREKDRKKRERLGGALPITHRRMR